MFLLVFLTTLVIQSVTACGPAAPVILPTDPCITYSGRTTLLNNAIAFDWSGVLISLTFQGTSISIILEGGENNLYNVFIDGQVQQELNVTTNARTQYVIAKNLPDSSHTLLLTKRTEAFFGVQYIHGFVLDSGKTLLSPPNRPTKHIEFIGDSISCGYGDEGANENCHFSADTENNYASYGPQTARFFNAEYYLTCWSGRGVVRNYGDPNITSTNPFPTLYNLTLATSTSNYWNFKSWTPDAVVINLGTNDYSTQPLPPQDVFISGYQKFISAIRGYYNQQNLKIFLVCGPLISQTPCCDYVEQVVKNVPNLYYVPMVGILTFPNDYGCDYHPNVAGQTKMAKVAIPVIQKVMGCSGWIHRSQKIAF